MDRKTFLKNYQQFQLGDLITETPHPLTQGLSDKVKDDLPEALKVLKEVDRKALEALQQRADSVTPLQTSIQKVLERGGRLFLCGCGATGRLVMLIESLWRELGGTSEVVAFMAGGDVALVHSLEGFEDFPEHGERHLEDLGYTSNDLFVGVTEGGETPYVIGATEAAARLGGSVFFIYCNPTELLKKKVERSRRVIENTGIQKIDLSVGPMALSGSTRLQASTVLQLALGWALLERSQSFSEFLTKFMTSYASLDLQALQPFILKEEEIYRQGEYVMYLPRTMPLTVFTDTTERSPTFSLPAFEPILGQNALSLSYVMLPEAETGAEAWKKLLRREPRPLDWPEIGHHTTEAYLQSFDFSRQALEQREERLQGKRQYLFEMAERPEGLTWSLAGVEGLFQLNSKSRLASNTLLKMMLNIHSTCLMGRMGRYQSNIMTWVRPSNAKLIDRATRYAQSLLKEKGIEVGYLDIVETIFKIKGKMLSQNYERGLVDLVFHHFTKPKKGSRHGS